MANEQNLRPCKPGQTNNPNGRPKKLVSVVLDTLRENGYENIKRSQVVDIYETLLTLPEPELKGMVTDLKIPMIYRIVAKEMLSKKGFDIIERMIDRTQGKAIQRNEITGEDGAPLGFKVMIETLKDERDKLETDKKTE